MWAPLFAFGMIAREIYLAGQSRKSCYTDCGLGSQYLSGITQITEATRQEWFSLLKVWLTDLDFCVKIFSPAPELPLDWLPIAPRRCSFTRDARMQFLKSLSPSIRYQKFLEVLKRCEVRERRLPHVQSFLTLL